MSQVVRSSRSGTHVLMRCAVIEAARRERRYGIISSGMYESSYTIIASRFVNDSSPVTYRWMSGTNAPGCFASSVIATNRTDWALCSLPLPISTWVGRKRTSFCISDLNDAPVKFFIEARIARTSVGRMLWIKSSICAKFIRLLLTTNPMD